MSPLDKLIQRFERFPGVGARQAKRFAFHILNLRPEETSELAEMIKQLGTTVQECHECHRYFAQGVQPQTLCPICADQSRDKKQLLVVSSDSDVTALERSGLYGGHYFVLGGTAPLLETRENNRLKSGALKALVEQRLTEGLQEIILGFAVNPDGENTGRYVRTLLDKYKTSDGSSLYFSELGRGLSTGSELEYADAETLKNALKNRS